MSYTYPPNSSKEGGMELSSKKIKKNKKIGLHASKGKKKKGAP